jgi:hypothetical protein
MSFLFKISGSFVFTKLRTDCFKPVLNCRSKSSFVSFLENWRLSEVPAELRKFEKVFFTRFGLESVFNKIS